MDNKHLGRLIDKFYAGTISDSEKKELDIWYRSFEDDEGFVQTLSDEEKVGLEAELLKRIDDEIVVPKHAETSESVWQGLVPYVTEIKVAAALSLAVLVAAIAYVFLHQGTVVHSTSYGEIKAVVLPDRSRVVLNGNSTLSYKAEWNGKTPREVTLEGEAFFSVNQTQDKQKFLVHTGGDMYVEVIGTEFTVAKRIHSTRVVLNSGKVNLNIGKKGANETVAMLPGEMVSIDKNSSGYSKTKVNPEVYSSWKVGKLTLDRTSLQELLTMIEDTYGVRLHVVEKDLLDKRISGRIPADNIDTLIQDIAAIYKVELKNYAVP